jgi:hypothetical protein
MEKIYANICKKGVTEMNTNNLWEAIGKIDDKFVINAIEFKKNENYNTNRWWIGVAVAIITIIATFSVTYTVNAQFREWVISLFQIKETEVVPNTKSNDNNISEFPDSKNIIETDRISLYAVDTIEDVFNVQYLKSTNYMSTIGSLFYYSDDAGLTKYYAAENNKFIPVESKNIKRKATLLGITGDIDYNRISYNGTLYLQENERNRFMIDDENDAMFALGVLDNNEVWLTLYKNPQSDQWSYPAKYNLDTGKTTDVLKGIKVDGTKLQNYPILTNWEQIEDGIFIVSIGQTSENLDAYLIDTNKKSALSLSDITGNMHISSAKSVSGKLMLMESLSDEKFNYYCYNYSKKSIIKIYDNAEYWGSAVQGDTSLKVEFSGGRYDFIEENGIIYLMDEFTGKRLSVEGITEELAEGFLINSDNDKILVSSFGNKTIKQIGIIDINSGRFYLMNRRNQDGVTESSIGWKDSNHVIIEATNDNTNKSYVYLYSLIE